MKVFELMSNDVAKCVPADNLSRVAARMWDDDIGAVVVMDAQDCPVGMVTDRDICMAAYTRGCTLGATTVGSLLGRPIVTCKVNDTVASAAEAMALHQVRRLPVVDSGGKLVGVLTLGDIARGHHLTEIAGAVLAIIATPRSLAAVPAVKQSPPSRKKTPDNARYPVVLAATGSIATSKALVR